MTSTAKPVILFTLVAAPLVKLNGRALVARAKPEDRVGAFQPAPGCYLGSDMFGKFREAGKAGGLKFADLPKKGSYALAPEQAARAAGALQAAGFEVRAASEDAAKWLGGGASQVNARIEEAEAALEGARARLTASGLAPRPYQEQGILWLGSRRSGLLLDEMGLGKTMQVLGAVPAGGRLVVVCPASVKGSWKLEVGKWRPDLRCTVLGGKGSFRWPEAGEVVVLNFEILPAAAEIQVFTASGHGGPGGVVVVADEAHYLTSKKAARTVRMAALVKAALAAGGRAWALTGTPIKNSPAELRVLLETFDLFHEAFGSWTGFSRAYGGPDMVRSSKAVATPEALSGLARVSLRREKAQVAKDLPPKLYQPIEVKLEGEAAALAARIEEIVRTKVVAETERLGRELTADEVEAMITRALTASTEIGDMAEARRVIACAKIPAALEIVEQYEQAETPIVVATAHRDVALALGRRPGWGAILGGDTSDERTETVRAFQAGELKGIALTIRAGGAGITLHHASTMLFVDRDWTAAANLQAEDRIHRIGQDAEVCTYIALVGDCWIDRRVEALVAEKARLMTSTTDVVRASGGQVHRAPALAEVKVGLDARQASGPELTADLRARLVATHNRAAALKTFCLASWLLEKFGAAAHLPPAVRGKAVMEAIADDEAKVAGWEAERAEDQAREAKAYEGRSARGAVELHAAHALEVLAGLDQDHAQERNDVGFAGSTQDGHRLARLLRATGGLSAEDWTRACAIAKYHRRQVGEAPIAEPERDLVAVEVEAP